MFLTVKPSDIFGSVYIQISKSDAHRALIAAFLSNGESVLKPWMENVGIDITATKEAISNFADLKIEKDSLKVIPKYKNLKNIKKDTIKDTIIDVKESGSSLRLLIPVVSALNINAKFIGSKKLFSRPLEVYKKIWLEQGLTFDLKEDSLNIAGKLHSGDFNIAGNISSQFISGLLFALPLLKDNSKIIIEGELESAPYVMMTLKTLKSAKIETCKNKDNNIIEIFGSQEYSPINYEIEADWSHAAFFAVAGALGGEVTLYGLNKYSVQGDKEILNILKFMGASVSYNADESITISKGSSNSEKRLNGLDINILNIPDLAPIIVALASTAKGTTKLYNAKRLRYKESDRINDLKDSFNRIGAKISATENEIYIEGVDKLKGGKTTSHNDHRIAMALCIASIVSKNDIIIDDAESINKSSFNFIEQLKSIGVKIEEN